MLARSQAINLPQSGPCVGPTGEPIDTASHRRRWDGEWVATALLIAVVLAIGLATARDYGITVDEFIFDEYGPKALAWYVSGFTDRSQFDYFDTAMYGPWFHILVTLAQSLNLADPFTIRHAVTFVIGLAGVAAVVPIGWLAVGRWAGFTALVLCLTTGNLYGHLFFTPNDVPYMAAMMWATLAILVMGRDGVPTWTATFVAGVLTGLAIATRFGGILTQAYLVGAMLLCALAPLARGDANAKQKVAAMAVRTIAALVVGWASAIVLWPYLQIANPLTQFREVYAYFVRSYVQFDFPSWGRTLSSGALPWSYLPEQLAARLPEAFVAALVIALLFGVFDTVAFARSAVAALRAHGRAGLAKPLLRLAETRSLLVVFVAVLLTPVFIMLRGSVVFDGIRHILFVLPLLAVLAAWALFRLLPLIRRFPVVAALLAALHVATTVPTMVALHPLEYVAMNSFAGGVTGAYGRFDLDYWLAAATEAVRRLEQRLAGDARTATNPPRIHVCIPWRESMTAVMLPRGWIVELDPSKADFVINGERSHCLREVEGTVIDEVRRLGVPFAWTVIPVR